MQYLFILAVICLAASLSACAGMPDTLFKGEVSLETHQKPTSAQQCELGACSEPNPSSDAGPNDPAPNVP